MRNKNINWLGLAYIIIEKLRIDIVYTLPFFIHMQMIPIDSFEVLSMNGKFVPISQGRSNTKLTFQNRKEYVEKALYFRLRELDDQVRTIIILQILIL